MKMIVRMQNAEQLLSERYFATDLLEYLKLSCYRFIFWFLFVFVYHFWSPHRWYRF